MRKVRFRTLGCYPLSGAVESEARRVEAIVAEMLLTTTSERQGRAIDKDAGSASMEKKKQEGISDVPPARVRRRPDPPRCPRVARRAGAEGAAALHHLRQRRRRQVDADRSAALRNPSRFSTTSSKRSKATASATARRGRRSTSRCSSTACPPSASRASPSTSPIASSRAPGASSSSPTRRATSSTRATW